MPTKFNWTLVDTQSKIINPYTNLIGPAGLDSGCWTAFRANSYVLPSDIDTMESPFFSYSFNSTTYASAEIFYTPNCTQYMNATNVDDALSELNKTVPGAWKYSVGLCDMVRMILEHSFLF